MTIVIIIIKIEAFNQIVVAISGPTWSYPVLGFPFVS